MRENPLASQDELIQPYDPDALNYDPLRPEEGYYYLWNDITGTVHARHLQSLENAQFVRGCSTLWPFLSIYRHWMHSGSKKQALERKQSYRHMASALIRGLQI